MLQDRYLIMVFSKSIPTQVVLNMGTRPGGKAYNSIEIFVVHRTRHHYPKQVFNIRSNLSFKFKYGFGSSVSISIVPPGQVLPDLALFNSQNKLPWNFSHKTLN